MAAVVVVRPIHFLLKRPLFYQFKLKFSTTFEGPVTDEFDIVNEEEIMKKRNKSRLRPTEYNFIHGLPPPENTTEPIKDPLSYKRKLYGTYGSESGVDPAICFPTKEEIENIKEYERVAFPYDILKIREEELQKIEDQKTERIEREKMFIEQMAKQQAWKDQIQAKINKKLAEAQVAKEKRDKLIEEVRRHFGYRVDPKEERFQLLLEEKEKEQLKLKKLEKKKKREEYYLSMIASLEASASSKVPEKKKNPDDKKPVVEVHNETDESNENDK